MVLVCLRYGFFFCTQSRGLWLKSKGSVCVSLSVVHIFFCFYTLWIQVNCSIILKRVLWVFIACADALILLLFSRYVCCLLQRREFVRRNSTLCVCLPPSRSVWLIDQHDPLLCSPKWFDHVYQVFGNCLQFCGFKCNLLPHNIFSLL